MSFTGSPPVREPQTSNVGRATSSQHTYNVLQKLCLAACRRRRLRGRHAVHSLRLVFTSRVVVFAPAGRLASAYLMWHAGDIINWPDRRFDDGQPKNQAVYRVISRAPKGCVVPFAQFIVDKSRVNWFVWFCITHSRACALEHSPKSNNPDSTWIFNIIRICTTNHKWVISYTYMYITVGKQNALHHKSYDIVCYLEEGTAMVIGGAAIIATRSGTKTRLSVTVTY